MIRDPWIRVHANLSRKPVALRLSEALRIDIQKAVGHLVTFWGAVAQHARHGNVADETDGQLEAWAEWRGKRGAFAAWVRADHLDDTGTVNEWQPYQGIMETRREAARGRMKNLRSQRGAQNVRRTKGERAQNGVSTLDERSHTRAETRRITTTLPNSRGGPVANAPAPDPNRSANLAELAKLNDLRAARGEEPKRYEEVYGA